MPLRQARDEDLEALSHLWYRGWRDAHAAILPAELARDRTIERFAQRLKSACRDDIRVVGPLGAPLGFYMLRGDELHQLYVAGEARGSGLAPALIGDAEALLRGRGVGKAWLDCAIGNDRAARFYEKSGWQRTGSVPSRLDTAAGSFALQIWRYEKDLVSDQSPAV